MEDKNLINEFKKITVQKWIKGINQGTNSGGMTFESLIRKKPDSIFFPDYKGIEVKCTQRFSRFPISLFSITFDGPRLFELNYILQKYGKKDYEFGTAKTICENLKVGEKVLVEKKYLFSLDLSEKDEKLYLKIYNLKNELIDKPSYILFSSLSSRLSLILNKMAIVWASKKKESNQLYFRYYKITLYKLISFEKFLNLLKNNEIVVTIMCRVSRSGKEKGKQRNKGLIFKIDKDNINKLFEKYYEYDSDREENIKRLMTYYH